MKPETETELRALPAWRNVAAVTSAQAQDDIAASLEHIRHAVADGLDVRVHGSRESADALRSEAVRSLRYVLTLGLVEPYAEQARKLLSDIAADDFAVTVPGGMAAVGWPSLAGKRGGAANADGALRGWLVRQLAAILPAETPSRVKTIAELVTFAGAECSQQLARSLLPKKPSKPKNLMRGWKRPAHK